MHAVRLAAAPLALCLSLALHPVASIAAPPVVNCADDGPGSLRDAVAQANGGDTLDLTTLQCSTITLTSGEIDILQHDLTLQGPGPGALTISAGGASRVLKHGGSGQLSLRGLTIADGRYESGFVARGGCIRSEGGTAYLFDTVVDNCTVISSDDNAGGGGISAGDVVLVASTVSGSRAISTASDAYGGGVAAVSHVTAKYSTIRANALENGPGYTGVGAGFFAQDYAIVVGSTLEGNDASCTSAMRSYSGALVNDSTISGNHSERCAALSEFGDALTIANSTIAFNHVDSGDGAGVYFKGHALASTVTFESSIIADNTSGAASTPADVHIEFGFLEGHDNLVMSLNGPPPPGVVTVTADPRLGPLQWNGGRTRTHALLAGSPAIGTGNATLARPYDQRGVGYPRTTGPATDIGALQFDTIFKGAFE
ncbi:MAG TPA: choice-of-anchor Q domain-containing protein [Rhodanobacteraceae bacterium]|nr:choice-of-anchor Q domain-containing protein [Rhodanobacteraceae bacterium]